MRDEGAMKPPRPLAACLAAIVATLAAASGCGAHIHRRAGTAIDWRAAPPFAATTLPAACRAVVVGDLTLPAGATTAADPALPLDRDGLRRGLCAALETSGAFGDAGLAEDRRGLAEGVILETRL